MCINQKIKMYFVATFLCLVHLTSSLPANVNSDQVLLSLFFFFNLKFLQHYLFPSFRTYEIDEIRTKETFNIVTNQPLNSAILISSCFYLVTSIMCYCLLNLEW